MSAWEAGRVADFLAGLDELTAKTGVRLSTMNPYLEVHDRVVGELGWRVSNHTVTYQIDEVLR